MDARSGEECTPLACVLQRRQLGRFAQLGEFEQESNADSEEKSDTGSHSAQ